MIKLTTKGLISDATPRDIGALREEFATSHSLKLPGFLGSDILSLIFGKIHSGDFETTSFGEFSLELTVMQNVGVHSLQLLLNDNRVRGVMEQITGCSPLRYFSGRIYRLVPDAGHLSEWHDDAAGDRRVGISINLSDQAYEGGCFEIRYQGKEHPLRSLPNQTLADAILFRIDRTLEHRVSAVTGASSKTAFAGWYHDQADFTDVLRCRPHPAL